MNDLYIRIENNQPVGNPILGANLREALGVDTNNLPPEFLPFERVSAPPMDFETFKKPSDQPTYQIIDGVAKDVWTMVDMDIELKNSLIQSEYTNKNGSLRRLKELAELKIGTVSSEDVSVWQDYLTELNAIDVSSYSNPYLLDLPHFPRKNADGEWMTRSEITALLAAELEMLLNDSLNITMTSAWLNR